MDLFMYQWNFYTFLQTSGKIFQYYELLGNYLFMFFISVFFTQITCPKNGTIQDLSLALGQLVNMPGDRLTVTDVYNHR